LSKHGYEGLTFEAVAELAGCSRPTLYRRYAGKSDLVHDLITARLDHEIEPTLVWPEDPRLALIEHLQAMVRFMDAASRDVTLALSQARRRDARIDAASRELWRERSRHYVDALHKASGGKAPLNFCELLAESLVGTLIFRLVMNNQDVSEPELVELVEQAIRSAEVGPRPEWSALPAVDGPCAARGDLS
jgi:AcrR family transcriptional regulator